MTDMEKKLPTRKNTRLQVFDYNIPTAYFVTICTEHKQPILSNIVGGDVLCQEQDCKQLCKMIVNTFVFYKLCFWKLNGA